MNSGIYVKGIQIVDSCKTLEQVNVARKWIHLAGRLLQHVDYSGYVVSHRNRELSERLNERRDVIYSELVN